MSVNFTTPQVLDSFVPGIRVLTRSSPALVVFQDKLFVFYNGSGNDGLFYTVYDGKAWAPVVALYNHVQNISVAMGTSPAAVVFNGTLYLFYNGAGHDGTFCATFAGTSWSPRAVSISDRCGGQNFLLDTSPSAAVYNNKLHLFWNGSENDGLWFTTFDATRWAPQTRLNTLVDGIIVRDRTSPSVCASGDYLYVFYNGFGLDGTWFTRLTKEGGGQWDAVVSVNRLVPGGMNFLDGTSPSATQLVHLGKPSVLLGWNGSGNDGLWHCIVSPDGTATPAKSLVQTIGAGPVLYGSAGGVVAYRGVPYIFWPNEQQQLWFASGAAAQL